MGFLTLFSYDSVCRPTNISKCTYICGLTDLGQYNWRIIYRFSHKMSNHLNVLQNISLIILYIMYIRIIVYRCITFDCIEILVTHKVDKDWLPIRQVLSL